MTYRRISTGERVEAVRLMHALGSGRAGDWFVVGRTGQGFHTDYNFRHEHEEVKETPRQPGSHRIIGDWGSVDTAPGEVVRVGDFQAGPSGAVFPKSQFTITNQIFRDTSGHQCIITECDSNPTTGVFSTTSDSGYSSTMTEFNGGWWGERKMGVTVEVVAECQHEFSTDCCPVTIKECMRCREPFARCPTCQKFHGHGPC